MGDGGHTLQAALSRAREALARTSSRSPEEKRRLLQERARKLASPPPAGQPAPTLQVVVFVVGVERYGLETSCVQEIHPLRDYSPLPAAPSHLPGIACVRGRIVPVLDLRRLFRLPEAAGGEGRFLVLMGEGPEFGVAADAIEGIVSLDEMGLEGEMPALSETLRAYLRGVAADRLVVLDGRKLLEDKSINAGGPNHPVVS